MPLDAKTRASLPDSAFAYIDSQGRRRLPINDAPHVRNALARFNQVVFEDEAARDKARTRLLRAASKYGVVPIGFVSAQLQPQRKLPKGHVTFLLTDVERSTELLARLEDRYAPLLSAVRRAALLTNEESKGVRLAFGAGTLSISSRAPEMGEAKIDLPVEYAGEGIEIGFNPVYLMDALKVADQETLTFEIKTPNKPGLLKSGPGFLYVVMPVNLS